MEPLVHYALPLTALLLAGVQPKKAAILAFLGVIPDIDALMLVHRSISHSIIIMGLIIAPLYLIAKIRYPDLKQPLLLAFLVLSSHPVLDLESMTPILWPITSNSYMLQLSLNGVMQEGFSLKPSITLSSTPTAFTLAEGFDYPLFTENGFLIAVILLVPIAYNQIQTRFIQSK